MRGPALRLGLRVPEDSVAPRCSRAALTALVPPPSWRPRSCGSNSRLSREGGSSSTVQARGRGQPPGPRPGQPVPPTMHWRRGRKCTLGRGRVQLRASGGNLNPASVSPPGSWTPGVRAGRRLTGIRNSVPSPASRPQWPLLPGLACKLQNSPSAFLPAAWGRLARGWLWPLEVVSQRGRVPWEGVERPAACPACGSRTKKVPRGRPPAENKRKRQFLGPLT